MAVELPAGLVDRLAANLRNQSKDVISAVHSRPVRDYLDPDLYARELQKLYHELPIVVAHSSQLAQAGDFITHDRLGVPLIIARTRSGAVAAFRNICRHRAAMVEGAACGHRSSFNCPYHNWSYGLDGALLHIPDAASFDADEVRGRGLRPVAVAEKHGLIFVRITAGPPIDLDAFLGDIGPELELMRVADHRHFSHRQTPLACNWKVMLEGSLETYHFNFLHAASAGKQFAAMACTFDSYAPHQRHVMPKRNLLERIERGEDPRRSILPTYCIFPNTMLTLPHDHMMLTQIFPVSVDRCVFNNALLTRGSADAAAEQEYWNKALALTESVNDEDFVVLEGIQKSHLQSQDERVIHGRYELGITRFHEASDQLLAGAWSGVFGRYRS
jgi:phenylpropionate dioxygenase-like ring-hydroxylating dioxygenase large terminal subunit